MTDGLYLSVSQDEAERAASEITIHPQIDLSTFSQWISLQPIEVHVWMLEEIANDLSRCHYGWQADEIRMVAKNLWAMVRRTP